MSHQSDLCRYSYILNSLFLVQRESCLGNQGGRRDPDLAIPVPNSG